MANKGHAWAMVFAFVLMIGACNAITGKDEDEPAAPSSAASPATNASAASTDNYRSGGSTPTAAKPVGETITVSKVIDGDTFELSDGQRVRVLGIDSCEIGTYGGDEAKSMAESDLANPYNQPITMTQEPGVDKDQYGRLLRYVSLDGYDFGESMVKYDHTGVYQGKNDASPEYIQRLYAADLEYAMNPPSGRECGDPYAEYRDDVDVDVHNNDDHNMRDGALTGGYCARKWWC